MRKILCLTSHNLDHPAHGAVVRARSIFKLLERCGEVRLVLAGFHKLWGEQLPSACRDFELLRTVYFEPTPNRSLRERVRHELDPRFMNTEWMQANAADQAWLQSAIAEHDLVWIHGLDLANGFGLWCWPNSVLDIDDIPSSVHRSRLAQAAGSREKIRHRWQMRRWQRHEKLLGERFNGVCVCSEPDVEKLNLPGKTFVVQNGFDAPKNPIARQLVTPPRIGFIGNFSHPPNRQGVEWFLARVWPLIRQKIPSARLRLAGAKSTEISWPADQNVDTLGWIADSESEMATWSLAMVPVLTGGGTRVKIAEALSRRCPMVSTSLGAYGYDLADGQDIFIADTAETFAARCLQILNDPAGGQALADNSWKKFLERWTWEAQADRVAKVVETVASAPR